MDAIASSAKTTRNSLPRWAADVHTSSDGLFPPDQVDHRRHAAVRAALAHLDVVLRDLDALEGGELALQQRAGIHVLRRLGAAGAVGDLLRPIALQQQQAAGLQRAAYAGEF